MDDAPPVGGNPPGSETSVILAGQPEPGRNVFAAEPIDPVKSQAMQDEEVKQDPEDKVVSTIAAAPARVINPDELDNGNKPSDSSDTSATSSDEPTSTGNSDNSDQNTGDKLTSDGNNKEPEPSKEQGPVVEEVAEADRVRAELFNENIDQGVKVA